MSSALIDHPALKPGRVAVITGAASGIGLAAAKRLAALGLNLHMIDRDQDKLEAAVDEIVFSQGGVATTWAFDVSEPKGFDDLRAVIARSGEPVGILMNNAGVGSGGDALAPREAWDRVLGVNFLGVLNGVQAFAPTMIAAGQPALIVNTGSKQGITTPPGDTAYNVSKAAVKALTEGLAHTLRTTPGSKVSAHLLIPGFVWTGLTANGRTEKPDGAWTAEQTVDFAFERIAAGDFYILCPDNETPTALDHKRIAWAAGDITENRPALSRWHPDYADAFKAFVAESSGGG
jgi:NAD(P)-dependent dehydrogenase (short-subunit alcohol dehydrogenase family)